MVVTGCSCRLCVNTYVHVYLCTLKYINLYSSVSVFDTYMHTSLMLVSIFTHISEQKCGVYPAEYVKHGVPVPQTLTLFPSRRHAG